MSDILERAKEASEKLYLPWVYDEADDQIVCQNIETETGEFGVELARWHEQICQYLGEKRSGEIIAAVNLLPDLITECEKWRQKAILERAMCYIGGPAYWPQLSNEYAKELLDRAEKELMK